MKLNVSGAIGFDFTAENFSEPTKDYNGDVDLHINSLGGDVYEAIAISNEIRNYQARTGSDVIAHYDGVAASAASFLSMAANRRVANDNSVFMLHNSMTIAIGDTRVMDFWAKDLASTDNVISLAYAKASGKSQSEIKELMSENPNNKGTWLYGQEIVDAGFAESVESTGAPDDKANIIDAQKVAFADFVKNSKPVQYDHERVVALISEQQKSHKANFIGDETVKKEEILKGLKNLKENNDVTLPEIAGVMNLSSLLITDEQKANLSELNEVKKLCGDKSPVEFVKSLVDEREKNKKSVRKAKLNEAFGPEVHAETKKVNHSRVFAEKLLGSDELTEEKINDIKKDETYLKLAADIADATSDYNTFGIVETKENQDALGDNPKVYIY